MAVTSFHGPHGVVVNATTISGITQANVVLGTQLRDDATSGEVFNRFQAIQKQVPGATFTTYQIKTLLDVIGLDGFNIGAVAGLSIYGVSHELGATRKSGSVNAKYAIPDGILFAARLSAADGGDATVAAECAVLHDGSANDPVIPTFNNAALTLTDAERFTLGPVTLENVVFNQITGIDIDFGISVVRRPAGSEIHDTFASIETIRPVITIRGTLVTWFGDSFIPHEGLAVSTANTTIYLKKRAEGGTYVANGTSEHIQFKATGLATIQQAFDDSGEVIITMPCRYDGTNDPITVDTAIAIT